MAENRVSPEDSVAIEEFWDDLLAFIEDGRVIPIVGTELHTVMVGEREVPLYRALAERLLAKYELRAAYTNAPESTEESAVMLRPHLELNDAVIALSRRGRRIADLYRPINDLLRDLLGPQPAVPAALSELAGIQSFHLFVTISIDNLLVRALDQTRFGGTALTERITYSPNLPGEQVHDIPERMPTNYCSVFHLFGHASSSPFYAIDDEDILEFVYNLQAERGNLPARMLAELRGSHLLIIGCNFADWLSRFFIRLSNQTRLSGDRPTKEFLVGDAASHDRSLTLFLERFSHNTRVYPGEARTFVTGLAERWAERHPPAAPITSSSSAVGPLTTRKGEIFISYSRTDLAAAKTLCSELEAIGAGVIWFDQSVVYPGDEWERQITAAIKRCDLFLPLMSANTEARTDGYFHAEWNEAVKRKKEILGRTFIVPVVLDPLYDGNADNYKLIPDQFRDLHFGHAPGGHMSEDFRQTLVEAVRELRRRRSA